MSQPPPSRVPEEILRGAGVGIREYYTRLTSGLYYLWDQLKNITESRVTLIENALPGISGVVPTRDSATELTFSSGYISTGGKVYEVSEITKTLGTAWAEGDAGGEFSGATIGNTDDYYCIAISKDSAPSTVDIGFDDNASGTNAPSGWTVLKEVFRGMTNGSGNLYAFAAYEHAGGGVDVEYDVQDREFIDNPTVTNRVNKTLSRVPPDATSDMIWSLLDSGGGAVGNITMLVTRSDQTDTPPDTAGYTLFIKPISASDTPVATIRYKVRADSDRVVSYRCDTASNNLAVLANMIGYTLERR